MKYSSRSHVQRLPALVVMACVPRRVPAIRPKTPMPAAQLLIVRSVQFHSRQDRKRPALPTISSIRFAARIVNGWLVNPGLGEM